MGKTLFKLFAVACATAVLIQLVPVDRSNPPVTGEVGAPDQVMTALRSACYDCHSYETVWPWYSLVAPVSWKVSRHVRAGRERLNFSTWEELAEEDQARLREEIWEQIERGAMPLRDYLRMHPEAVLTQVQEEALQRWTLGEPSRFPDWDW